MSGGVLQVGDNCCLGFPGPINVVFCYFVIESD